MSEEEGNLTDDVASTLESAGISMCCHNSYLVKDRKQSICESDIQVILSLSMLWQSLVDNLPLPQDTHGCSSMHSILKIGAILYIKIF